MIDIAMDSGDLVVTVTGDLAITPSDDDDIIQTANNSIHTILGENMYHENIGNDSFNKRLKIVESGLLEVQTDSQAAIEKDNRIAEVRNIQASKGSNYGECVIEYTILTVSGHIVDGKTSVNIF